MDNRVDVELSDKKLKSKKTKIFFIAIISGVIILLIGLVSFIAVETTKKNTKKKPETLRICNSAHEVYGSMINSSYLGIYEKFAISADNRVCSAIGKEIFEKNGSAVDVAIATALCNSIMNSQSMGLGGGHFMNIYIKHLNKSYIIDAREKAPLNSFKDMFKDDDKKALYGGLATGIPGEIKGYWEAHKIGGFLPWKDLFVPAINLCKNGFKVSNALSNAISDKENFIRNNSAMKEIFINSETNKIYKENDTMKMPNLAKTLEYLAKYGADAFYNGILTGFVVSEINENGGNVTIEDFQKFEARIHEDRFVVRLDDNYRIYTAPPPSSGILVPFIMKIMKGFGFKNENNMSDEEKNIFYHHLIEAFKHAYSKRTFFGDENFLDLKDLLKDLQNDGYIDLIRNKIFDNTTFPSSYYGSALEKQDAGTAHISVLAPNGDAVSITSTVNNYFGAKYAGRYTGIIYNDIMDDFSIPGVPNSFGFAPTESNFIEPEKKPLSSMTPIIIVDNDNNVRLVLGAAGGSKIISAVSQVAIKSLWMGMDIKSAIDSRRIHHQLYPNNVDVEVGFPQIIEDHFKKVGHKTRCFNFGGSTVQGIQVLDKSRFNRNILAYADPRKGGRPDGF